MTVIYQIQSHIKPERIYIGSAVNFSVRKSNHLSTLRKGRHHSAILQNHYNKYGESDLEFSILEKCAREQLIEREQYYIDTLAPVFNICRMAGSSLGAHWVVSEEGRKNISNGHKGLKHSEESRRKRSEKLKGRKPSELARKRSSEVHKGEKLSDEHIAKLRKANKGNQRAKGKHWKLSEETKAKMRASAIRNKNETHFKSDGSTKGE